MKKVIYTAMVGGYDNITQPYVIANGYDYILFTNDIPEQQLGVWTIKKIPYSNKENTRIARWVKTHPHVLLKDYDYSLWIDSNVIVDKYDYYTRINELIKRNSLLASMDHIERDCVYDEAYSIIYYGLDKTNLVLKQVLALKYERYPKNNGMIETNCVLRQHNNPVIKMFCEEWWRMINTYSKRDQLSFNYISWKLNINIDLILPKGNNSRNHKWLHCDNHKKTDNIEKIIWTSGVNKLHEKKSLPCYKRLLLSESHSMEECYQYYKFILIRKYYNLVVQKYKYCTKLKNIIKSNKD